MARVLVLGGGFGGIAAALRLRERLLGDDEVLLVDRRATFVMGLRKTWAALGMAPLSDGERPLATLASSGVNVRLGTVEAIDPQHLTATVDGEELEADAMVVALGADLRPDLVPGLAKHGIDVWDRANARRARMAFDAFSGGRLVIAITATPYACPPGPYELALLAKERLDARGIEAEVEVVTPTPIALPVAGPLESRKLEDLLAEAGIGLALDHPATGVDEGELHFEEKPSRRFDLLFGVSPHRCPKLLVAAGLAEPDGWVKVDPATLETRFPGVYAVGDCTGIMLSNGKPLPKAGVMAEQEGEVAADRIADELAGREPTARFAAEGVCYVETGGGLAGAVQGRFFAEPPQVEFRMPTAETAAAKAAFESDRLSRWFGS